MIKSSPKAFHISSSMNVPFPAFVFHGPTSKAVGVIHQFRLLTFFSLCFLLFVQVDQELGNTATQEDDQHNSVDQYDDILHGYTPQTSYASCRACGADQ